MSPPGMRGIVHGQARHAVEHEDVEVVEAAGLDVDHRLAGPGLGLGPVGAEPELVEAAVGLDRDRAHLSALVLGRGVFGRSSKRKSQCEAPSITVCVRVSFTAGLKPSTSEKSRLHESSAPTSGMPSARYISA